MKGHPYTFLDKSFSTLIRNLMMYAIYTITSLLERMHLVPAKYNVIELQELHCLRDFCALLEPHVNCFWGFLTGQYMERECMTFFCARMQSGMCASSSASLLRHLPSGQMGQATSSSSLYQTRPLPWLH
eukprot:6198028-Pleurochrysis_carterae.AAC.8